MRRTQLLALFALALLVTACDPTAATKLYHPSTAASRDKAGGVLLSVNSVGRWEPVADAMKPNFKMASGDAALAKVLPATARIQQQVLDALGVSLRVGLPQSSSSSTTTATNQSEGETETNSNSTTTTREWKAGEAPSNTPAGGEFPEGKDLGNDLGIDPLLQYRAAASLYQSIQLMNREVELAAQRKGYVPYLVRMQLVNIPYRRHLPYDVHAQVEFFPSRVTLPFSRLKANSRLPYVVPLIATDDLEQSINSRAAEVARQIGLAVNMMHGAGASAGVNRDKRDRESILATDTNSLLTVARLNDNGIYIRLGAANEATGRYSMVGRTYDITLLLLVPVEYFGKSRAIVNSKPSGGDDTPYKFTRPEFGGGSKAHGTTPHANDPITLSVIVHTNLRNAVSGELLPERSEEIAIGQVDAALHRTLSDEMYEAWKHSSQETQFKIARTLISPIQRSDYSKYFDAAYSIKLAPNGQGDLEDIQRGNRCKVRKGYSAPLPKDNDYRLACISGGYLRSLWTYLASISVESSTKSASVELPEAADMVIPKQTALLRDDGKEKANILLRDVSGITPQQVSARLVLNNKGRTYEFPAEGISPDPSSGTLDLQFPSPAKWHLDKVNYARSRLVVEPRHCDLGNACARVAIATPFRLLRTGVEAPKPKAGFEMRTTTNEIVTDKGMGTVKLVFDKFKDDRAELTWNGAEVKSAKSADGTDVAITLDKITLQAGGALTLEVQNAKPNGKVTFKAVGYKGKNKTGETTTEFNVVAGK